MKPEDPYGRVFRRGAGVSSPFQDPAWPILLFPEWLPKTVSSYFEPLKRTALEIGDAWFYLADEEEPSVVVKSGWMSEEFARKRFDFPLGVLMYADSRRWGAVLTDQGFTCVGAEFPLLSQIAAQLGGRRRVQAEFDDWVDSADGLEFDSAKADALRALNRREP